MKTCWLPIPGILLLLMGCGGSSPSSVESLGTESTYGPVSTRSVGGVAEPVVMQGAYSSVTGVFGANFLNATVSLPESNQLNSEELLGNTMLAYSDSGRPVLVDYGTGKRYSLNSDVPVFSNIASPSFSANGALVLTVEYDTPTSPELFLYASDGSSRTKVPYTGFVSTPNLNAAGTKIAFVQGGDIWTMNTNGSSPTRVTTNDDYETQPKWNPSGTKIGYLRFIGGSARFWEIDTSSGVQVEKVLPITSFSSWDYNPTGTEIVVATAWGGNNRIDRYNLISGSRQNILSAADSVAGVTWSPEGSQVAYVRSGASGVRIESARVSDGSTSVIQPITSEFAQASVEWGPLVRKRSFIASSSSVLGATNAAGFLYGMAGDKFASFLAFDAVTRNTVDIDIPPPAGFNPSNHFATITAADNITMLRYANGFSGARISVVDPGSSSTYVQGAVVSFNAATGKVSAVLPFKRSRSGEKPTRTEHGGQVTYRGEFPGVWDANGKRSDAPATEVTMDLLTGKVIECH
jgi:Tol biopolymer transport system component